MAKKQGDEDLEREVDSAFQEGKEPEVEHEDDEGKERPPEVKVERDPESDEVRVSEPPRGSRRERREAYRRVPELEGQIRLLQQQIETMRATPAAAQAPATPAEPPSPAKVLREKLTPLWKQQERIQRQMMAEGVSEAERDKLKEEWYDLETQKRLVEAEAVKPTAPAAPQMDPQEVLIRAEFGDVLSHNLARTYAAGKIQQEAALLIAQGKPVPLDVQRTALQEAAERFGIRQPAAPAASPAQKQRYSAVPAQAGGKGVGEVKLNKHLQGMARAMWPELKENEAYAKMARLMREEERSG